MPLFEFVCRNCDAQFEALVPSAAAAACPSCQSRELTRQLSVFAMQSGAPAGVRPPGACGACGDPRGPGSCSRD